MSYTQSDIDNLKAAIKTGVLSSKHGDETLVFRSLREMRQTLAMMEREVNSNNSRIKQVRFQTSKGI